MSRSAGTASSPASADTVSRQKRAGQALRQRSRDRLLVAAAEVFAAEGYAGATVNAIAERAGVSLQTLYTAWGSKRRLLRAFVEHTMTGSATAVTDGEWLPQLRHQVGAETHLDPEARLRRIATIFCAVAEKMALPWKLVRDGAAVDPDVAADHADLETYRRRSVAAILEGIDQHQLRPGLDIDQAIDTAFVIASPDTYATLVHTCGYPMERFERWVGDTLIAALLKPNMT